MERLVWFLIVVLGGCSVGRPLTAHELVVREQQIVKLLRVAVVSLRDGSPEALELARGALEDASGLDANDARVLDGLGCLAWLEGDVSQAEDMFKKAIAYDRSYDRPYAHLALVAEYRGHHLAAGQLYQIATSMNPLNYRSANNYAVFQLSLSDSAEDRFRARQWLMRARANDPVADGLIEHNKRAFDRAIGAVSLSTRPED